MNSIDPTTPNEIQRTLDREVELLMSAVNLVASRGAPSAIGGRTAARRGTTVIVSTHRATERGVILGAAVDGG